MKGTIKPVNNEVPRLRRDSSVVDLMLGWRLSLDFDPSAQIAG